MCRLRRRVSARASEAHPAPALAPASARAFTRALALTLAVAFALALSALTPPAAAQPGGLTVEATTPWSVPGWPVPVQLLARSVRDVDLAVDIRCAGVTAQATVAVRGGVLARHTVLVPAIDSNALGCRPTVNWRSSEGDEGVASGAIGQNQLDVALIAPHAAIVVVEEWRVADVTAAQLPDRWQGYPLDAVFVVGPEADAALTDAQRAALATWSRAGGRLLLLDLGDRAGRWNTAGAVATVSDAGYQQGVQSYLDVPPVPAAAPWRHRVPGTETVPVGGFLAVALVFAILVGPVNLWWVIKKRKQRGLLLVTTPLLSLAACAILIGYNLLSEGLGVKRAAVQLTWLDSARHTAVSFTGVTFFAGTSVDAFSVGPDVLVRPVTMDEYESVPARMSVDASRPREVRWSETAQELLGEWIPTRINRQLAFVAPEADRRRLTLARTGDGYALTNGLDVAIGAAWWVDDAGRTWVTNGALAPGHSDALHESSGARPVEPPLGRFGPGAERVWRRGSTPGHVVALLIAPLTPIPGPGASDEAPLEAWLAGPLTAGPAAPAEVAP